jgi:hypothetical protein
VVSSRDEGEAMNTQHLVACPLCGADKGYFINEGSTCLWWSIKCTACVAQVCECRAGKTLWTAVQRCENANAAWNAAGAYAHRLRVALETIASRTSSEDPCRALVHIARDALRHNI